MNYSLFLSGPLICAPLQIGALLYLYENGIFINKVYASGGSLLPSLLLCSGYNYNIELVKALKMVSKCFTVERNPWTLWMTYREPSVNKVQNNIAKYIAKNFGDMKHELSYFLHNKELNHFEDVSNLTPSPTKLFVDNNMLYTGYRLNSNTYINAELNPNFFKELVLPDKTICLRGQLGEITYEYTPIKMRNLEVLSSHVHLPEKIANKSIFLHSSDLTSVDSFWKLTSFQIEKLVEEGFSLASDRFKELEL